MENYSRNLVVVDFSKIFAFSLLFGHQKCQHTHLRYCVRCFLDQFFVRQFDSFVVVVLFSLFLFSLFVIKLYSIRVRCSCLCVSIPKIDFLLTFNQNKRFFAEFYRFFSCSSVFVKSNPVDFVKCFLFASFALFDSFNNFALLLFTASIPFCN